MYINVLEDMIEHRKNYKKIIEKEIIAKNYDMRIGIIESDPYIFLQKYSEQKHSKNVFFFDIDLKKEVDGLDVAKEIRTIERKENLPKSDIIFLTTYEYMMPLTYRYLLETLDFISKDQIEEVPRRISECLELISKRADLVEEDSIMIENKSIKIKDILYVETYSKNKVCITGENLICTTRGTLKEFEDKLETYNFEKISKSVLVNKQHIKGIDTNKKMLMLQNDSGFQISYRSMRKYSKENLENEK